MNKMTKTVTKIADPERAMRVLDRCGWQATAMHAEAILGGKAA